MDTIKMSRSDRIDLLSSFFKSNGYSHIRENKKFGTIEAQASNCVSLGIRINEFRSFVKEKSIDMRKARFFPMSLNDLLITIDV